MNTDNGALEFDVRLSIEELNRQIEAVKRQISGMSSHVAKEGESMDGTFRKIGTAAAAYFSFEALKGFSNQLIRVRGEFQSLDIAFTTMLGSKAKADALMAQIVQTAAKTPFTLTEVAAGAKQLLAYQVAAEDVNDTIIRLGNISAGVSVPIGQLVAVYGQVKAKGKLQGDDMKQFMNAGIPIVSELAKVMNIADTEVQKLISDGKVGFPEVQKVIENLTNEGGMFYNLMEEQSKTLTGQISNLEDAWDRMLNNIGENNEGLLSSIISGATSAVDHYEDVLAVIVPLVSAYGAYKAAVIATYAAQKAAALVDNIRLIGMFRKELGLLTAAQQAFNTTAKANPIGLAMAAIAGLGVAIYQMTSNLSAAEKAQESYNAKLQEANDKISDEKDKVTSLISVINNESVSRGERNKKLKELIAISPEHLNNLTLENAKTKEGKEILDEYLKSIEKQIKLDMLYAENKESIKRMSQAENGKENLSFLDKAVGAVKFGLGNTFGGMTTGAAMAGKSLAERSKKNNEEVIAAEKDLQAKIKEQIAAMTSDNKDAVKSVDQTIAQQIAAVTKAIEEAKAKLASLRTSKSIAKPEDIDAQEKLVKDLQQKLELLTGKKAKAEKSETKTLEDEISKRRAAYEAYYAFVALMGGELTKEQKDRFTSLLKDGESFTAYLENMQAKLKAKATKPGAKEADYENLSVVTKQLNEIKGIKSPFEQFQESLSRINEEAKTTTEYLDKLKQLEGQISSGKTGLNPEEKTKATSLIGKSREEENKKAVESIKQSAETYQQKLDEINRSFEDKLSIAAKNGLSGNIAELNRQWVEAKQNLDASFVQEFDRFTGFFSELYGNAANMSKQSLNAAMADVRKLIAYVKKESKDLPKGITPEVADKLNVNELVPLYEKLNTLQDEFNRKNNYPFANIIRGFKQLKDANKLYQDSLKVTDTRQRKIDQGNAQIARSKGMEKLANGAMEAAGVLNMVSEAMAKIAEASGSEAMKESSAQFSSWSSTFSATAQGFASGGPWGALASGVTNMIGQTVDAYAQDKAEQAEYLQSKLDFANKLKLLDLSLKQQDYENIFGVKEIRKAIEAYKLAEKALKEYDDAVNKKMDKPGKSTEYENMGAVVYGGFLGGTRKNLTNEFKTLMEAYKKGYTELQGMAVKTKDRSGWANFWGKKDQYKALKDYAPQLWGADGTFSVEKAKAFLETDKKINAEQRAKIQNVIDLKEAYDANMEIVRQDIQDTFGSLGSAVTDSIVDAINNGTNAWESFTKAGYDSLEALGKKIAYELFFANKFDALQKKLEATYGTGANAEEVGKQQMAILQEFFGNIKTDMTSAQAWMANWKKMTEEAGFSDAGSANSTLAGSISATITEDTATLISGYINAIRINQEKSVNIQISMLSSLNVIAVNTSYNKRLESIDNSLMKLTTSSLRAFGN